MQMTPRIYDRFIKNEIMRRLCNTRCHAEIADDELTLFAEEFMLEAKQPLELSPRHNQNYKFV